MAIDRWVEVAGQPDPITAVSPAQRRRGERRRDPARRSRRPGAPRMGSLRRRRRPAGRPASRLRRHRPLRPADRRRAVVERRAGGGDGARPRRRSAAIRWRWPMLCRDAEHEARGVPTGLLDQLASILGVAGHALLLDCSTNTAAPTPLPPADEAEFVVFAGAPAPARRHRVRRAGRRVRTHRAARSVRCGRPRSPTSSGSPTRRCGAGLATSSARTGAVRELAAALAAGDLVPAGGSWTPAIASLRDDYESSSPAVDRLCADLATVPGVFGTRITGGGWGGAVVALARPGRPRWRLARARRRRGERRRRDVVTSSADTANSTRTPAGLHATVGETAHHRRDCHHD